MPGLHNLTEQDLDEFLTDRCLMQSFTLPVICAREAMKYGTKFDFTPKEKLVYELIVADLAEIDEIMENFKGSKPQQECKFNQEEDANNGYKINRLEYIGRHVVSITRPNRDHFYWTIGVKDSGGESTEATLVTGYYTMGTNGTIADVKEALESTKHLFPAITVAPAAAKRPGLLV